MLLQNNRNQELGALTAVDQDMTNLVRIIEDQVLTILDTVGTPHGVVQVDEEDFQADQVVDEVPLCQMLGR